MMLCSISSECNGTAGHRQCDFLVAITTLFTQVQVLTPVELLVQDLLLRWVFPLLCWYKDFSLYFLLVVFCTYTVTLLLYRRLCFSETTAVSTWKTRFTELKFLIFLFLTFSFSLRHIPFETLRKYKITRNFSLQFVNIHFREV